MLSYFEIFFIKLLFINLVLYKFFFVKKKYGENNLLMFKVVFGVGYFYCYYRS